MAADSPFGPAPMTTASYEVEDGISSTAYCEGVMAGNPVVRVACVPYLTYENTWTMLYSSLKRQRTIKPRSTNRVRRIEKKGGEILAARISSQTVSLRRCRRVRLGETGSNAPSGRAKWTETNRERPPKGEWRRHLKPSHFLKMSHRLTVCATAPVTGSGADAVMLR